MTAPPVSRPSLWKSQSFQLFVGVCISLICLWFAAGDVIRDEKQRQEFVDAFKSANYRLLPLLLVILAAFYALKAYRWSFCCRRSGNIEPGETASGLCSLGSQ